MPIRYLMRKLMGNLIEGVYGLVRGISYIKFDSFSYFSPEEGTILIKWQLTL